MLASAGSGVIEGLDLGETATPDSAGVTAGAVADTIVVPYNVVPTLDESVAVVIVEPVAANMGLIAPGPAFWKACAPSATGSVHCCCSMR